MMKMPTPTGGSLKSLAGTRYAAFAAVLLLAIVINLVQFRSIDDDTSAHFSAIHRYDVGNILEIGLGGSGPFREMYSLYLALAAIAPDSQVYILRGGRLTRHEFVSRVYSFGEAASVERVASDALVELLSSHTAENAMQARSDFDPTPFIIARGEGGDDGPPWALAVDTRTAPRVDLPPPERFVAEALAGGLPDDLPRHPREFVLLEWDRPIIGSEFPHQDLLIEVSLLPEEIRGELAR